MSRALKPATAIVPLKLRMALDLLRKARILIDSAEAPRTAARVRLAITSCGGAIRHAERRATSPMDATLSRARRPEDDEAFEAMDQDAP